MRKKCIMLFSFFVCFVGVFHVGFLHAQYDYKERTGYLIQKVEPITHYFFIPFKNSYVLPFFYGFYVLDEDALLNCFETDTVNYEHAIMLCDPAYFMFADSSITKEVKQHTRIKDILLLDDSEIYEIGNNKYVIRKIKYAYFDNSQVKVFIKGYDHYMWDDLTSDEFSNEFYTSYEVGQLYNREYYQCYHHLIEILPTSPLIKQRIWKKVFQLEK